MLLRMSGWHFKSFASAVVQWLQRRYARFFIEIVPVSVSGPARKLISDLDFA
jgi:hypothetical protein